MAYINHGAAHPNVDTEIEKHVALSYRIIEDDVAESHDLITEHDLYFPTPDIFMMKETGGPYEGPADRPDTWKREYVRISHATGEAKEINPSRLIPGTRPLAELTA